jgi:hypothetical protein
MADEENEVFDTTKSVIALIDSALFKIVGKIISIVIIPVGLFFLYHAWDALEQHGKDLAGIQITLNDIEGQVKDLKEGFGAQIGQISHDEHEDQTDIAVLKSEVERPSPPLSLPVQEQPEPAPPPPPVEHHFRRVQNSEPPIIRAIQNTFKGIGNGLSGKSHTNGAGASR